MEPFVIQMPRILAISSTKYAIPRLSRWVGEEGYPDLPAGNRVIVESIEMPEPMSLEELEKAFVDPESEILVQYRLMSGNKYHCDIKSFSLGEASVIIQAAGQAMPGESDADRTIGTIDRWAEDFRARVMAEADAKIKRALAGEIDPPDAQVHELRPVS